MCSGNESNLRKHIDGQNSSHKQAKQMSKKRGCLCLFNVRDAASLPIDDTFEGFLRCLFCFWFIFSWPQLKSVNFKEIYH